MVCEMALAELWQIYLSLIILQGFNEKVITLGCGRLDWNNLSYMCEGFFLMKEWQFLLLTYVICLTTFLRI